MWEASSSEVPSASGSMCREQYGFALFVQVGEMVDWVNRIFSWTGNNCRLDYVLQKQQYERVMT